MTRQELEAQCMALSHLVDTEVVERDPQKIDSFDESTFYVWMEHPQHLADGEPYVDDAVSPKLHARLGRRNEAANSVPELARKLGLSLH